MRSALTRSRQVSSKLKRRWNAKARSWKMRSSLVANLRFDGCHVVQATRWFRAYKRTISDKCIYLLDWCLRRSEEYLTYTTEPALLWAKTERDFPKSTTIRRSLNYESKSKFYEVEPFSFCNNGFHSAPMAVCTIAYTSQARPIFSLA